MPIPAFTMDRSRCSRSADLSGHDGPMRAAREILRQEWALGRTHREVARNPEHWAGDRLRRRAAGPGRRPRLGRRRGRAGPGPRRAAVPAGPDRQGSAPLAGLRLPPRGTRNREGSHRAAEPIQSRLLALRSPMGSRIQNSAGASSNAGLAKDNLWINSMRSGRSIDEGQAGPASPAGAGPSMHPSPSRLPGPSPVLRMTWPRCTGSSPASRRPARPPTQTDAAAPLLGRRRDREGRLASWVRV
jgi:hypothetical protein